MKMQTKTPKKNVNGLSFLYPLTFLVILIATLPSQVIGADRTWELSLGCGGYISNVYYGSDETYVSPFPDIKVSYKKGNFSSSASFLDGIGVTYMNPKQHFLAGIKMNNGEERNREEYRYFGTSKAHSDDVKNFLKGTPNVSTNIKTEIMLGYISKYGIFGFSLEYHPITQEMAGESGRRYNGYISSLTYTKMIAATDKLTVTPILAVNFMDKNYSKAWYSVEQPTQSLSSFKGDAGLRDVQMSVLLNYQFNSHNSAALFTKNSFLLMDAGDSPYTTSKHQLISGFYWIYRF